jgi:transcriptional regulator with GAF, ATPase, and Fis domain
MRAVTSSAWRLVGIAGPARGSSYLLDRPEILIGRDPSSGIVLPDSGVSPRHGLIRRRGEQITLAAVAPEVPIFVNGLPAGVAPRRLRAGDEVSVGESVLLVAAPEAAAPGRVVLVDHAAGVEVVRELAHDEGLGLTGLQAGTAADLPAAWLASLVRIGTAIGAVRGLVSLRAPVMDLLRELVPSDRLALIIGSAGDIESMSGLDTVRGSAAAVRVERRLIEHTLHAAAAVLARRLPAAPVEPGAAPRGQIVVAPMLAFGRVLGAVYLDADDPGGRFTVDHLHLVMLVAGMAAIALDNARNLERLEGENRGLRAELDVQHGMVGTSPAMRTLYQRIARIAPADSTVLICGESGTGKELIARALHRNSSRAPGPFVAINCAALAETLLESELFGHEKGAFTGAVAQKKGRLEMAEGGTVFLDEIGELPPGLQAKLLRALQEREFDRVGGTRPVRVNVRVVAATNRDLDAAMREGTFRRDLYYRLNVVSLVAPALRERPEDITALAEYFARKYGTAIRHRPAQLAPDALERLRRHDWPGNVRELENAIERAVVLGSDDTIEPADLGDLGDGLSGPPGDAGAHGVAYHDALLEVKRSLVLQALQQADGKFTAAAKLLDLHPNYLHRLIRNLNLRVSPRRVIGRLPDGRGT